MINSLESLRSDPVSKGSIEQYFWSKRGGASWDRRVFIESYEKIHQRLERAGNETEKILLDYYTDSFMIWPDQDYSYYEDEFSMPIPIDNLELWYKPEIGINGNEVSGASVQFLISENKIDRDSTDLKIATYGPCRMFNVGPGDFVFLPYEEFNSRDVIGSDAFTGCTAVIVKTEKGVFFAHVRTGAGEVKKVLDKCKQMFEGRKEIEIIRPEWKEDGKIQEYSVKQWGFLDDHPEIKVRTYSQIEFQSDRPAGVSEFSVLFMENSVHVLGVERDKGRRIARPDLYWK